ncbi:TonB-dependent copper receptor [Thiohalophilus thiocyanatoxydans]|uniref:Iron complex outermembrane receptor protein n=1 Tax=Thiohalophilus thiocyanatoxydans TaxID=381308 RepID=A0A4R8IT73_9GAMM|nr:TonB-dependent copper receptor [Thiohalophilus thiocyanatoxydans]TDY04242.1 iron complex outermembrane receptor protein [Thiohalophilus thiocyanatoxydans]
MQRSYSILSGMILGWSIIGGVQAESTSIIDVEADRHAGSGQMTQQSQSTEQAPPADGGEWLRALPGVGGVKMGAHGVDPVIRGQKQNQLNVLLDGAYVFGGCPNRMDPPSSYAGPATYDQLTVIRGVQSLLYGSGGSGGTVLFERTEPVFTEDKNYRVELGANYASNGDAKGAHADVATGGESGFVRAIVDTSSANSYEDGDGNKVRSGYDETGGVLDLGYRPDADSKLSLSLEASRGEDIEYAGANMDAPISDHDLIKLGYESRTGSGRFSGFDAELYSSAVEHVMDNYSLRTNNNMWMRVPSESDTTGGRIEGDLLLGKGLLTLGLDVMKNDRDATRYGGPAGNEPTMINSYMWPGVSIEQWGMVAEYAAELTPDKRYTAGLRIDQVDASASKADLEPAATWGDSPNTLYSDYYGKTATPSDETNVGALLRYEQDLADQPVTLFTGLSRTVRTADATERFMASDNMTASSIWVGNPDLEPEAHHQIDAGLDYQGERSRGSLTIYYDRVNDYILRDRARGQDGVLRSDLATVYRNVDAELYGVDLEGSHQWSNRWSSDLSIAYVRATNTTESRPIAQTPPLEGTLSLEYRKTDWRLGAELRAVAEQSRVEDDINTDSGLDAGQTAGFTVYNLYGTYRLNKQSKINFGVDNVTDKTYAEHLNKPSAFDTTVVQVNEPGRSYWAKVNVVF